MPVPGLFAHAAGMLTVGLSSSSTTTDLHAAFGSPSSPIVYRVIVGAGVLLGSTSVSTPALDASGFHVDSVGEWFVEGDIIGCGGAAGGGYGYYKVTFPSIGDVGGGGGGGGAGSTGGALGVGWANGSDGSVGGSWPVTTGGAAGANSNNASLGNGNGVPSAPESGGDAVSLSHAVTINLAGTIGGGGSGGAGGAWTSPGGGAPVIPVPPVAGGALGVGTNPPAASGGYAIRYSGSGAATVIGGTVIGTVG